MRELRVLFFGDSHAAGVGDPSSLGWVGRAVAAAYAAGLRPTPYNLGVRGETSLGIAARWEAETARRVGVGCDNRVVFAFGANDTELIDGRPLVPPDQSARILASCLATAQASGLPAFVIGPAPFGDGGRVERIRALAERFARICGEFDVPFARVDQELLFSTDWVIETAAGDGAHPREAGYALLARLIAGAGFIYWLRTGRPLPMALRKEGTVELR
jgi:acyl-CoA thioesterase I